MAFINKKEKVLDIKLTQFGKNSLSRGVFKPSYYQFFDDNIIYDVQYAGVTEEQNSSENRIKEKVTFDTQYLVKGLQTRFDIESDKIQDGTRGVFEKLVRQIDPLEKEKLLQSPIYNSKAGSQDTPTFTLVPYTTNLKNTTGGVQYLTQSGIHGKIPQLEMTPEYKLTVNTTEKIEDPGTMYDAETYLDLMSERIEFIDKSFIEIEPECIAITLDEFNVPYTLDNFEIELYEIIHTQQSIMNPFGTVEKETKLVAITDPQEIFDLFEIKTDKDADKVPSRKRTTENFYTR